MKVILLEDVKGTGKKGQMFDVSDGHARNYLIPRKLAVEATKSNVNDYNNKQKSIAQKQVHELEAARELEKRLAEMVIKLRVKTGGAGKLFGSVTTAEIASAMEEQAGFSVDKKKIVISEQIKTLGEKSIEIKLHPQVKAKVTILVCSQE